MAEKHAHCCVARFHCTQMFDLNGGNRTLFHHLNMWIVKKHDFFSQKMYNFILLIQLLCLLWLVIPRFWCKAPTTRMGTASESFILWLWVRCNIYIYFLWIKTLIAAVLFLETCNLIKANNIGQRHRCLPSPSAPRTALWRGLVSLLRCPWCRNVAEEMISTQFGFLEQI